MSGCDDLVPFADGELDADRHCDFALHLQTCESCRAGLIDALRLSAGLSTLQPDAQSELERIKALIREWVDAADAMAGAEPEIARFNRARLALREVVTNPTRQSD